MQERSIVDLCLTDSCITFKDFEKRVRLSSSIMSDCQKRDVNEIIVISSDEDEEVKNIF